MEIIPNSRKNLKKGKRISEENAREYANKSAKSKRVYKDIQECFKEHMDDDKRDAIFERLYMMASRGNLKAIEMIVKYLGEEPAQKIEQTNTNVVIDFGNIEGDS